MNLGILRGKNIYFPGIIIWMDENRGQDLKGIIYCRKVVIDGLPFSFPFTFSQHIVNMLASRTRHMSSCQRC